MGSISQAEMAPAVLQFIMEAGLDERATKCFQSEAPDVQKLVIERGPLSDCTNPSSAVMGRIRDARSHLSAGDVESFIQMNGLDERASVELRKEPPHIQKAVMDRGSLQDCQNPNSAVMGRIRDAKGGRDAGGGNAAAALSGGATDIESLLVQNAILTQIALGGAK